MADRWIERFRKEALPKIVTEFGPQKIIFFGSRVRGGAQEDSDLDIILISSSFEKVPFVKRMSLVLRSVPFPKHVDYLCYSPEEYEKIKHESTLVMDALEHSLEIAV